MTAKNETVTRVVFRKFDDGEVIALFPEMEWDNQGLITSYLHNGQHGGASRTLTRDTSLASLEEYADLKKELEGQGYILDVRSRMS